MIEFNNYDDKTKNMILRYFQHDLNKLFESKTPGIVITAMTCTNESSASLASIIKHDSIDFTQLAEIMTTLEHVKFLLLKEINENYYKTNNEVNHDQP